MKQYWKRLFITVVFSFLILTFLSTSIGTNAATISRTSIAPPKFQIPMSQTDQVLFDSVLFEGSRVSIALESELTTLVGSGMNFYILIMFEGNGDITTWEATMLYSYSNSSKELVHWMLNDPFVGGQNWIEGFMDTHYQSMGNLIQLTFIEYTALGYPETHITALPLLSTTSPSDFSAILFEFSILLSKPTESPTTIPTTTLPTKPATNPTESKPSDQVTSGFASLTLVLTAIPIILARQLRKKQE